MCGLEDIPRLRAGVVDAGVHHGAHGCGIGDVRRAVLIEVGGSGQDDEHFVGILDFNVVAVGHHRAAGRHGLESSLEVHEVEFALERADAVGIHRRYETGTHIVAQAQTHADFSVPVGGKTHGNHLGGKTAEILAGVADTCAGVTHAGNGVAHVKIAYIILHRGGFKHA